VGRPDRSLTFALGGHPAELLDGCELLILSGGVSPELPLAQEARRRGIPLANDALLTLRHTPVPVIGITGSAGKTTTTTLVGLMLEASGFGVHVGGNIGTPLLDRLDRVAPGDKMVLELSSFQAELLDRSPAIAVVLNITPNHLDRHPSMSHYAAAKANLLRFQQPGDTCVLGADDPYSGAWLAAGRCEIAAGAGQEAVYFPLSADRVGFSLVSELTHGAFLRGSEVVWRQPGLGEQLICHAADIRLRGWHNLANFLAAVCAARAGGASVAAMERVAREFSGVEHRLEVVRRANGVTWVNDSIATAPERTIAALRSFDEPLVVLLGGRDKNLPWEDCIAQLHHARPDGTAQVRRLILFGEAAELIRAVLSRFEATAGASRLDVRMAGGLDEAVQYATEVARTGDVVLLSPGGTSFDAYADFAERGSHFRKLVGALQ
jgi:UDP-N-acetylmuramoylalanine--D-glutamate ligase